MYADREEAALAERKKRQERSTSKRAKQKRSWSYSSSVSRSVSPSRSRSRSRSPPRISPRRPGDVESRERELQEQLRKRAMMSKRSRSTVNASNDQLSGSPDAQEEPLRRIKGTSSKSPDADQRRTKERSERRQGRRDLLDRRSEDRSDDEGRRSSKRHKSRRDSIYDEGREEEEKSKRRRRRRDRDYEDDFDRRSSNRDVESRHGGDSESGSHYDKRDRRTRRSSRASEEDSTRKSRRSDYRAGSYYDSPRSNGGGGSGGGYYDSYYGRYDNRYGAHNAYYEPYRYDRSPSPPPRRRRSESRARSPDFDDYELRSIFCSQLAARLTQRDLGEFFEDKLGEGTVMDVRIVMDKITGRSKGVGYVELKDEPLVEKALGLSGTVLFGIPIIVQKTDAARNKGGEASSAAGAPARPNLPAALSSEQAANLPKLDGNPIHIDPGNIPSAAARLYVGNLHFSLTEADIKSVFEPFGAILSVDLHREPGTLKSKGFSFVQFVNTDVAEKAIEHMNGFELAGRNIKVNHVNSARASGTVPSTSNGSEGNVPGNTFNQNISDLNDISGAGATLTSSFDEGGGGGLTASSRAALMEKLARIDRQSEVSNAANANLSTEQNRPSTIPPQAKSRGVQLKNMFNPEEETERGWELELAEDIKEECQQKYGKVDGIKVDVNSMGEVYIRFSDVEGAQKAVQGLNGRFFGGRSISAAFISEGFLVSMLS